MIRELAAGAAAFTVAACSLIGCVRSSTVQCGEVVCSGLAVCTPSGDGCALPVQIDACAGRGEGTACSYGAVTNAVCVRSVCVPSGCGNGLVEPGAGELCDDGNLASLDGCSADCTSQERCGDGVTDGAVNEDCDCGDGARAVTGCSGPNADTPGATCRSDCTRARCGDGVLDPSEWCDDANTLAGDGCRADCQGRWTRMASNTFVSLQAVWGSAPDDVFAVGFGRILHYDGVAWQVQPHPPGADYSVVVGSGPAEVLAATYSGHVDHYDGAQWRRVESISGVTWATGWSFGPGDIWLFGHRNNPQEPSLLAQWNGATVSVSNVVGPTAVGRAWATGPTNLYATGDGLLWHHDGSTWRQPEIGGVPISAFLVWGTAADDVYAIGPGGLLRFDGNQWQTRSCSLCNELGAKNGLGGTAGDLLLLGQSGEIVRIDDTSERAELWGGVTALHSLWGFAPGRAFIVGANGTILY